MWKIILFQIVSVAITASNAADLYCTSFSATNACASIDHITNVAAPNEAISVIGQPATYTDAESNYISLTSSSQFDFFPTKIFSIFPAVQALSFDGNNLPNMVTDAFANCNSLNYLYGNNYKFTHLPAAFARNCTRLIALNLMSGELTTLDPNALEGLTSLTQIAIVFNKIACVPPGFFAHTPNIQGINLAQNQIVAFDSAIIQGLPKLTVFDLQVNKIAHIHTLSLTNTGTAPEANMLTINYGFNPVVAIDPKMLSTTFTSSQLNSLYLSFSADKNFGSNCITEQLGNVDKNNYVSINASLAACYNNWTPQIENMPLPCAPTTTTSTTTFTTAAFTSSSQTASPGLTQAPAQPTPCCQKSVLEVILNVIRNMTFSANFN